VMIIQITTLKELYLNSFVPMQPGLNADTVSILMVQRNASIEKVTLGVSMPQIEMLPKKIP